MSGQGRRRQSHLQSADSPLQVASIAPPPASTYDAQMPRRRGLAAMTAQGREGTMADRQIVAIGGGGVSQDPDNPHLLDFLVGLTGRDHPRVCLVQTASGDRESGLVNGYQAFSRRGCEVAHLAFFPRIIEDMRGL